MFDRGEMNVYFEQVPLSDYFLAVNVQRRVLATLGLEKRRPPVDDITAYARIDKVEGINVEVAE